MKREIEVKYLLKDLTERDGLLAKLQHRYPAMAHTGNKRIISYFYEAGATKEQVLSAMSETVPQAKLAELTGVLENSGAIVVKCRSIDATNFFAVKGTPLGEDPVHAVNRLEFEVALDVPLETIDSQLQAAGIVIASKWSSQRDFYSLDQGMKAEIEFVSGYGYKAELELVIEDGESVEVAQQSIRDIASELTLTEASQALLGRMYAYYNQHWQEYFDTDKTFPDAVWTELKQPA